MTTAKDVLVAVRRHYGAERDGYGPEWAALDEFTLGPGTGLGRADLFLVRAWSGRPKGHERILIEVKVSRSDLTRELAKPQKMAPFARISHRTYFAAPAGLVKDSDDLGEGVGLLEVCESGRVKVKRRAARRTDVAPVPEGAFIEAFRRASRVEARVRSADADSPDAAARVAALEGELAAALRAADRARISAERESRRMRDWFTAVARVGGIKCVCGELLLTSREPTYRHTHPAGVVCTRGYPEPDLYALSVQLGLAKDLDGSSADT